jgi:dethiobiotin synthetase
MELKYRGLFITGTDTDIGVMKPIETGFLLRSSDAFFLKKIAGVKDSIESISPYRLKHPLSPFAAAQIEDVSIHFERIARAYEILLKVHQALLVEGAGGLLVPITRSMLMADLALRLNLPILIISRISLGTLNHTLLTVEAARRRGIKVIGVVFNHLAQRRGMAEKTNLPVIKHYLDVPILGEIPYASFLKKMGRDGKEIRRWVEAHVDMHRIRSIFVSE